MVPSLEEIHESELYQVAQANWIDREESVDDVTRVVAEIWSALTKTNFGESSVLILEQSKAFESILFPSFSEDSSDEHTILAVLVANSKLARGLPLWDLVERDPDVFESLFNRAVALALPGNADDGIIKDHRAHIILFVTACFYHLESAVIRKLIGPLISISIWTHLEAKVREGILSEHPSLGKAWKRSQKKLQSANQEKKQEMALQSDWIYSLLSSLHKVNDPLCKRAYVHLLIAIASQLPTRRYPNTLFKQLQVLPILRLSYKDQADVVDILENYMYFSIDDYSGEPLTDVEVWERHSKEVRTLQQVAFSQFREKLHLLALTNFDSIHHRPELEEHLAPLDLDELKSLADAVGISTDRLGMEPTRELVVECFVQKYKRRNWKPLLDTDQLPTEKSLFDPLYEYWTRLCRDDKPCLPMGGYNVGSQYLTTDDMLFHSMKVNTVAQFTRIRQDIQYVMDHLQPAVSGGRKRGIDGQHVDSVEKVEFGGYSKRATLIAEGPSIVEKSTPLFGQLYPGKVLVETIIDLGVMPRGDVQEWDRSVTPGSLLCLAKLAAPQNRALDGQQYGIEHIRTARVSKVLDGKGQPIRQEEDDDDTENGFKRRAKKSGEIRKLVLEIDPRGFLDPKEDSVVESLNFVARLPHLQDNAVKSGGVDELPSWLADVVLGFGDPTSASVEARGTEEVDFVDTILDQSHLEECLGEQVSNVERGIAAPYKFSYKLEGPIEVHEGQKVDLKNKIRFNTNQVHAICRGANRGLTLVQGSNGTGKTSVGAQIINVLYHSTKRNKTLLISRTSRALERHLGRLLELGVDIKHMIHLCSEPSSSSSKYNGSSYWELRGPLLGKVDLLAKAMAVPGAHGDSCETAEYFYQTHVKPVKDAGKQVPLQDHSWEDVDKLFRDLREIRPLELVKNPEGRQQYFAQTCPVIAMTARDAIEWRAKLSRWDISFDSAVVVEAGQLSELTTVLTIPNMVSRVVLIGDETHVVPTTTVRDEVDLVLDHGYGVSQSLLSRLVRLGVPKVDLSEVVDPEKSLTLSIPRIPRGHSSGDAVSANSGLGYTFQVIDVTEGVEERMDGVVQNAAEAEYAVWLYQYMRLLGYPACTIAIVTATHGQRQLVQDIVDTRARGTIVDREIFGAPGLIATVHEYQGVSHDYVICSTVFTRTPFDYRTQHRQQAVRGALAGARKGLYVLSRKEVIQATELKDFVVESPDDKLAVVPRELYGKSRRQWNDCTGAVTMENVDHLGMYVRQMTGQRIEHDKKRQRLANAI